jgi:hypothetical protein
MTEQLQEHYPNTTKCLRVEVVSGKSIVSLYNFCTIIDHPKHNTLYVIK